MDKVAGLNSCSQTTASKSAILQDLGIGCCKPYSTSESLSDSQWSSCVDFLSHPYKVRPSGGLSIWHCASLGEGLFSQSVATPLYLSNMVLLCLLPRGCISLILGLWDFQNGVLSMSIVHWSSCEGDWNQK